MNGNAQLVQQVSAVYVVLGINK